jgi:hypothetical protein
MDRLGTMAPSLRGGGNPSTNEQHINTRSHSLSSSSLPHPPNLEVQGPVPFLLSFGLSRDAKPSTAGLLGLGRLSIAACDGRQSFIQYGPLLHAAGTRRRDEERAAYWRAFQAEMTEMTRGVQADLAALGIVLNLPRKD